MFIHVSNTPLLLSFVMTVDDLGHVSHIGAYNSVYPCISVQWENSGIETALISALSSEQGC